MTESPFAREASVDEWVDPPPLESLLERLRSAPQPFLLESGSNPAGMGAWHILGAHPIGELLIHGTRARWAGGDTRGEADGDPWHLAETWWQSWQSPATTDETWPFLGGAVGYLGYELGETVEDLPTRDDPEGLRPDLHLRLYDEVVLVSTESGRTYRVHRGRPGIDDRCWWREAPGPFPVEGARAREVGRSLDDAEYLARVEELRAGIGRGDYYEVNLSRRTSFAGVPSPWELHRRLRERQPVPYGALLPWEPVAVVSASPERFLRRKGRQVETRPIKGTAPRTGDDAQDAAARDALLGSAKEHAELAMIIDLERNDLGRVCEVGSVEVTEEAALEAYATVFHTVATVRGTLRPEVTSFDLLRATFPGGSITGAPKIAAMQAIRALEPVPRKVYTGSVGWIAPDGDLDLSIAIRTLLIQGDEAWVSVGGAITWDSVPESELAELAAKGRAIFEILAGS